MGIRVHKRIGYGLDNVVWRKKDKYSCELTDPRFDVQKFMNRWRDEDVHDVVEWSADEFYDWCKDHTNEIAEVAAKDLIEKGKYAKDTEDLVMSELFLLRTFLREEPPNREKNPVGWELQHRHMYDTFHCSDEFAIKEVFIVSPFSATRWDRYDDTIDWHEETTLHRQENRYEWLGWAGLYPYNANMIRFRGECPDGLETGYGKGGKIDEKFKRGLMGVQEYSMMVGHWDPYRMDPLAKGETLKDLKENWRCTIPIEIHAQLLALGFIKDVAAFVDELRPMLYVYWG